MVETGIARPPIVQCQRRASRFPVQPDADAKCHEAAAFGAGLHGLERSEGLVRFPGRFNVISRKAGRGRRGAAADWRDWPAAGLMWMRQAVGYAKARGFRVQHAVANPLSAWARSCQDANRIDTGKKSRRLMAVANRFAAVIGMRVRRVQARAPAPRPCASAPRIRSCGHGFRTAGSQQRLQQPWPRHAA